MINCFLLLFLFLITPFLKSMDYDSEFEKLKHVERSRQMQKNGFEGCKNKEECGMYGCYLTQYSPEGLCTDCEFKQYPKRFVACLFCRRPSHTINSRKSFSCFYCISNIEKLICQKFNKTGNWKQKEYLERGTNHTLDKVSSFLEKKYIAAFIDYTVILKAFSLHDTFSLHDSGAFIYRGAIKKENGNLLHVWVNDFTLNEEDIHETTWEDCGKYIESLCEKYNIFGPETGECILDAMPENVIATYEEVIES